MKRWHGRNRATRLVTCSPSIRWCRMSCCACAWSSKPARYWPSRQRSPLTRCSSDPEWRTWLRLSTALAKYLTAEYAIAASRAALELIGGNGYTSDYPVARLLRDAQVLTVWEGPANIQALELLRLLARATRGWEQYQSRVRRIVDGLPQPLGRLAVTLRARLAATARRSQSPRRDEQKRATARAQVAAPPESDAGVCAAVRGGARAPSDEAIAANALSLAIS